jgi:hypothetical protein
MAKEYGGDENDWFHATGDGFVDVNGQSMKAEIHWFECDGVGAVIRYIKVWR